MRLTDSSGIEFEITDGASDVELQTIGYDVVGKALRVTINTGMSQTRIVFLPLSQISGIDDELWGKTLYIPFWLAKSKKLI